MIPQNHSKVLEFLHLQSECAGVKSRLTVNTRQKGHLNKKVTETVEQMSLLDCCQLVLFQVPCGCRIVIFHTPSSKNLSH